MVNSQHYPPRPAAYLKKVALLLQGGGALGSYQAGVYEALASSDYLPTWVAGISIGAINAALIAGNPPAERVARLREFWDTVTAPTASWPTGLGGFPGELQRKASTTSTVLFGQPGFFTPRDPFQWWGGSTPASYYDSSALKGTLERLVDFDRINRAGEMRFSVAAVNVRTGQFAYFDNRDLAIRPEHVMASAALPPALPAVEIDGESYWDGGLVSNTPLQYVTDDALRRSLLCFQVDLFQAYGVVPRNLDEVAERHEDLRFSSRTRATTEASLERQAVRHAINALLKLLPPELADTPQAKRLRAIGTVTTMDVVQLIYRSFEPQGAGKVFDFSRDTLHARWAQGKADAETTLHAAPWLAAAGGKNGVRVFDVVHDLLVAAAAAELQSTKPTRRTKDA